MSDSDLTKPFRCAYCKVKYSAPHPKYYIKKLKKPYCSTTCVADVEHTKSMLSFRLSIEEFSEAGLMEHIW